MTQSVYSGSFPFLSFHICDLYSFSSFTAVMSANYNSQMTVRSTNMAAENYNTQPSRTFTFTQLLIAHTWTQLLSKSQSQYIRALSSFHCEVYAQCLYTCWYQAFVYCYTVILILSPCLVLILVLPCVFCLLIVWPLPECFLLPYILDLCASFNKSPLCLHLCPYLLPWHQWQLVMILNVRAKKTLLLKVIHHLCLHLQLYFTCAFSITSGDMLWACQRSGLKYI